jgi:hypothetical protein
MIQKGKTVGENRNETALRLSNASKYLKLIRRKSQLLKHWQFQGIKEMKDKATTRIRMRCRQTAFLTVNTDCTQQSIPKVFSTCKCILQSIMKKKYVSESQKI